MARLMVAIDNAHFDKMSQEDIIVLIIYNSIKDPGLYYEEYVDKKFIGTTMETTLLEEASTDEPSVTDPSIYSQLLWNSYLKKIDSSKN